MPDPLALEEDEIGEISRKQGLNTSVRQVEKRLGERRSRRERKTAMEEEDGRRGDERAVKLMM